MELGLQNILSFEGIIELHFHKRRHQYSSTELRNRVYSLEKEKRDKKNDVASVEQYSPKLLDKYELKND